MIRLIASDIDGTLLQRGATEIPQEVFEAIRELKQRGIYFCAASGRRYDSLRELFAPVIDDIYFLCEGGAIVYGPGKDPEVLAKFSMDKAKACELVTDVLQREDCEVQCSGENYCYLLVRNPAHMDAIMVYFKPDSIRVDSPYDIPEDIIKMAVFCENGIRTMVDDLYAKLDPSFFGAISAPCWSDITGSTKGIGLTALCRRLDIPLSDVMAFGDNHNDVSMLDIVGYPRLMEGGAEELLSRYPICENVPAMIRREVLK